MKAFRLSLLLAGLIWADASCRGQMSTFPAPPPLAPASDRAEDSTTNNVSSAVFDPGMADPTRPAPKETTTAPSPASTGPSTTATTPVTAATLTTMTALDDKVSLDAGDTISFRVIEDRDDPVTRIVTDTGEIDFPYVGRMKVTGKTCHQVALEVKKLLEVDYYKHATVIVGLDIIVGQDKSKPRDLVWVVGQVHDVGPQELSKVQTTTVSQVILRAGGFGDFADQRKVKIIHRGSSAKSGSEPPDLSNIKEGQVIDVKSVFDGKSTLDPIVRAGDYIIVPKKIFNL